MWILVQGGSTCCRLAMHSVRPPRSVIPRASLIVYSFVSNTSFYVPEYVFCTLHLVLHHVTLTPVRPGSRFELSVENDTSPGLSECLSAFSVPSLLSSAKGTTFPGKVSDSTHIVYSMPAVVSILVPSVIVPARRCPSVCFPLPMSLNQSSSHSTSFFGYACSSSLRSVTERISFVDCDLGAL